MQRTFEYHLEKNRLLIFGVSGNEEIKARIAAIYPDERIASGKELYRNTRDAFFSQKKEKLESSAATNAFNNLKDQLYATLVKLRDAVRYFFKNEIDVQKSLLIEQQIPSNYAQWIVLAESSFNAVLNHSDALAKLTIIGFDESKLGECLDQVSEIEALRLAAEKEDGEAQQATQIKHQYFDELMTYCDDLRECLGLFYTGADRQRLEEVGIVVK